MNKTRRNKLYKDTLELKIAKNNLIKISDNLTNIKIDEEIVYENTPDNLQDSDRAVESEMAIDYMEQAIDLIGEGINKLKEAIDSLEEIG